MADVRLLDEESPARDMFAPEPSMRDDDDDDDEEEEEEEEEDEEEGEE